MKDKSDTLIFATLFICILAVAPSLFAATYYVATNGSDAARGSSGAPFATFNKAFSAMKGGDTLLIKDGNYDQEIRCYYGEGFPSGSASAYTVIRAENDWKVSARNGRIDPADRCSYFHIQGILFEGGGGGNCNHAKFIRCGFRGTTCTDNVSVVGVGTGSHHVLFEDCFAFGCGRYKFITYGDQGYNTENIIFRRCVSRHDYHEPDPGWGRQCANFVSYDSHNFTLQNCIAINSGNDDYRLYGHLYGGIWWEYKNTTPADNSGKVQGCIFLDLAGDACINDPKNDGNRIIENCVTWDCRGGYGGGRFGGNPSAKLDHLTFGDIYGTCQDLSFSWGVGATADADANVSVTNSILTKCNSYGLAGFITSNYNAYFNNLKNFGKYNSYSDIPVAGPNDLFSTDPKLKYICRVEDDSPLKGAASDGGDIGANIIYRYGRSGTLWGEPGFDELTNEPLWPFPNEEVIKKTMRSWDSLNDGTRGFCTDGNGLYGGPVTLTSYIWEYLGNSCPLEICGGSSQTRKIGLRPANFDLKISPNPCHGPTDLSFNIKGLRFTSGGSKITMRIFNSKGHLMDSFTASNPKSVDNGLAFNWNASGIPAGVYIVRLQLDGKSYNKKLYLIN